MEGAHNTAETHFLPAERLQGLLDALRTRGLEVIGPTLDQQAIVYGPVERVEQLPRGWTDVQEPGRYRLEPRDDEKYFGYVVGPHSWKRYLFPPLATLSTAHKTAEGWEFRTAKESVPRYAFLGVRACELAALRVQDRVFLEGPYVDPVYAARRQQAVIIAVNCTQAAATCFCTSMGTGPACTAGFDLSLTEIPEGFTVVAGSALGTELIAELSLRRVTPAERSTAASEREQAVQQITRTLSTEGIRDLLLGNLQHPRWDDVAQRCLSCANCTMVCPTCFCSSVQEVSDLAGTEVQRERVWDSCFQIDFSVMNGQVVRNGIKSRYRQWLTHKLASWIDQFGTSGCVGCGRCITWCPVGIDLTEEVAAIRGELMDAPAAGQ